MKWLVLIALFFAMSMKSALDTDETVLNEISKNHYPVSLEKCNHNNGYDSKCSYCILSQRGGFDIENEIEIIKKWLQDCFERTDASK